MSVTDDVVVPATATATATATVLLFPAALILTTAVLSRLPGAPSAPGCLAASGRQARLRQAAAGAPASLRRTRWRGFGLSLRSDASKPPACSDRSGRAASVAP
ncbi:hypothetical protein [Escherichia coli]|uniref:hypothetical protein n=4 Tax=Enterobacteriaceae TaxID=543 RepID=UPI00207D0F74|nr:hypothetical protein [Escherichia coli]